MKFILTSILFLFILFSVSKAQWTQCNGPLGGTVNALLVNGTSVFASASDSGVFRSNDNCKTWKADGVGLQKTSINRLGVCGSTIFAGGSQTLFRSTNNGGNWNKVNNYDVAAFAAIDTVAFMATSNSGVFRSLDSGKTWVVTSLQSKNASALMADGESLYASDKGKIYLSTDRGDTWTQLNFAATNKYYVSIFKSGPTLFVVTDDTMFRTTDNGLTLTPVYSDKYHLRVSSFIVSGSTMFIGTYSGGVCRSIDNGITWIPVNNGITNYKINTLTIEGTTILAGVDKDGVFISEDMGETWAAVGMKVQGITTINSVDSTLFVGTGSGIFSSTDMGSSWSKKNSGFSDKTVRVLYVSDSTIYAGTGGVVGFGLFRSTDRGNTWSQGRLGVDGQGNVSKIFKNGKNLFASNTNGRVFRSFDNGDTWTEIDLGNKYSTILSFASVRDTLLIGADNDLLRSTDNGESWTALITKHKVPFYGLAVSDTTILASVYTTLLRSTDKGETWTDLNKKFMILFVDSITGKRTSFYARTDSGAVYQSTDNGTTWMQVLPELRNLLSLAIYRNTIFAGTSRECIWKAEIPIHVEEQTGQMKVSNVFSCYPNPTTNSLTIDRTKIQFPENTNVHYTLSTLTGGMVMEFDNNEPKFTVSLDGMVSGVYYLTAVSGVNKVAMMVTVVE